MKVSFNCPECDDKLSGDHTIVGTEGRCPTCGSTIQVQSYFSYDLLNELWDSLCNELGGQIKEVTLFTPDEDGHSLAFTMNMPGEDDGQKVFLMESSAPDQTNGSFVPSLRAWSTIFRSSDLNSVAQVLFRLTANVESYPSYQVRLSENDGGDYSVQLSYEAKIEDMDLMSFAELTIQLCLSAYKYKDQYCN